MRPGTMGAMPTVTLVKNGRELAVSSHKGFVDAVYGQGYLPKTGSIGDNWNTLSTGVAAPPDLERLVRASSLPTDLQEPAVQTVLREAAVAAVTDSGQFVNRGGGVLTPTLRVPQASYTLLSTFQSGHGWAGTGGTAGGSAADDTSVFEYGTRSHKVTVPGGAGSNYTTRSTTGYPAVNCTGKHLAVLVRVDVPANLGNLVVTAGDGGFTNFYQLQAAAGGSNDPVAVLRANTWTWLHLTWADQVATGGTPTKTAITDWQVRVNGNANGPVNVWLGAIGYFTPPPAYPNGVLSLGFDDAYGSHYSLARPVLDTYGLRGDLYPIVSQIGLAGMLTEAQIGTLHDKHGWGVNGHAFTAAAHNAGYTTLTSDALFTELYGMKEWLATRGYRGADILAIPKGMDNADVTAAIARRFSAARHTNSRPYQSPIPEERAMRMRAYQVNATTTPATVTALIDSAYANGWWLNLVFHDIKASGATGIEYNQADLNTIAAYAATKGIPVRTAREVLAGV